MGKTSGRGHKGAKSRSGWSSKLQDGGTMPLFRRLPKRGFSNARFARPRSIVNLSQLAALEANTDVTPELLQARGILKQLESGGVKVLGNGEIARPLSVAAHAFSQSAVRKIEAAGGTVRRIPPPAPPVRNKMRPRPRPGAASGP